MNKPLIASSMLLIGALAGAGLMSLLQPAEPAAAPGESQPLYWVAPMDASYRRDAPGKSPMGMDLVPVYEDSGSAGEVSISPLVENNLGVRTAVVVEGALQSTIRTVGYVRFDEDRLLHLHPRVEGWIEKLNVKTEGEFIRAGQPVYSIYSPMLVSAQEELVLALERDNSRLISSAEERLQALQVPQSLIEGIRRDHNVRQTVTIYAPQDGLLAELGIREGHFVKPGSALMSIGVLDEVWVIAEVFERQASLVSVGDRVTMSLDYLPGREWQGEVDFIYPTLDAETRTISVRLRFDNADQVLKPNMFAQVSIHSEHNQPTLLVPNEALIRSGIQDRVVLALGEGRFKSVAVSTGRRGDHQTEVLSGLQAGDRIVTSAQFLLDSESSIDSDFKRMDGMSAPADVGAVMAQAQDMNMDHSEHAAMAQSDPESMDHSEHAAMAQSDPESMDHSEHQMMDHSEQETMDHSEHAAMPTEEPAADARWVSGKVDRVMGDNMLSVTHEPIPEWQWPSMSMMFEVQPGLDISGVRAGDEIELEITRQGSSQVITGLRDRGE